jgi:hypothetical protein
MSKNFIELPGAWCWLLVLLTGEPLTAYRMPLNL